MLTGSRFRNKVDKSGVVVVVVVVVCIMRKFVVAILHSIIFYVGLSAGLSYN
jgi:hypothetical protein